MTTTYSPPLAEIGFVLEVMAGLPELASLPGFDQAQPALVTSALEEAARWVSDVVAPLNRTGDREHCHLHPDGEVTTPEGFRAAYAQWLDAGWGTVPFPPEYGGGGFPWTVAIAVQELLASANLAFSLCPQLTQGAIELLLAHGNEAQRQTYLPHLVSGAWTGTMNLTEPQAGSDVGALSTRAVPDGDGGWRITGQKIFITYGAHDFTDNIVHLVLARIPDAPPGTRGISCFVVPKRLVNPDGSLGGANGVTCISLEEKLGIHASPTCTLAFEDAYGEMVGEPNNGMRYMFTMMNNARLSVGLQGVAVGEAAYQLAAAYARERVQGRTIDPADRTIIGHPDVRRMLLTQRASIEASRALVYLVAGALDRSVSHPDAAVREYNHGLVELLIPVAKAWSTDVGARVTSIAVQVHGGMGYIEETGVAQHYRDSRISPIYEGTNGIQAIDLVTRKLPMAGGTVVKDLLGRIAKTENQLAGGGEDVKAAGVCLGEALEALTLATNHLLHAAVPDQLAGASPYLEMMGVVVGGWLLATEALVARQRMSSGSASPEEQRFLSAKVVTARFFLEQQLPQAGALLAAVQSGAGDLMSLDAEQF